MTEPTTFKDVIILDDLGAGSGREKVKLAGENLAKKSWRALGTELFQTALKKLASDWTETFFALLCPIGEILLEKKGKKPSDNSGFASKYQKILAWFRKRSCCNSPMG